MLTTCYYEQLDQQTKAYLRDVRQAGGRGAPGIYFPVGSSKPIWAFILGGFIICFTMCLAGSTHVGPFGFAALVTGGFLFGGWLMLYAIRRWTASTDRFGRFRYFDPAHAFVGEGDQIRYAALPSDTEIAPVGENGVAFESSHGSFVVTMQNRMQAAIVADYYSAVDWVLAREEGRWAGLPLCEAGAVARYLVENDAEPASVHDTGVAHVEIPEEVTHPGRASTGVMMLGVISALTLGLFLIVYAGNGAARDHARFDKAKEMKDKNEKPGKIAVALRDYLKHPDNKRHTDDAKKMLAGLYDGPINEIKNSTLSDPDLRKGMIELLESMKTPEDPAATLSVMLKPSGFSSQDELRKRFADGISESCGGIGMIAFVAPAQVDEGDSSKGYKPSMIAIEYEVKGAGFNSTISWTVTIRVLDKEADAKLPYAERLKVVATKSGTFPYSDFGIQQPSPYVFTPLEDQPELKAPTTTQRDEQLYNTIMQQLLGKSPAKADPNVWD